jgi:ABC-type sugar transport system substrate-binding protein
MEKIFNAMDRHPGKTIATVVAINIGMFLGAVAVIALAVRYVLTGHIG